MNVIEEQRICIKFCFKIGYTAFKTMELLHKAFGENTVQRSTCYEWFNCFNGGSTSFKDRKRSGRRLTEGKIKAIQNLIKKKPQLSIRSVAETVGISYGSCYKILREILGGIRVNGKYVLQTFIEDNRVNQKQIPSLDSSSLEIKNFEPETVLVESTHIVEENNPYMFGNNSQNTKIKPNINRTDTSYNSDIVLRVSTQIQKCKKNSTISTSHSISYKNKPTINDIKKPLNANLKNNCDTQKRKLRQEVNALCSGRRVRKKKLHFDQKFPSFYNHQCRLCNKKYSSLSLLQKHSSDVHPKCLYCKCAFRNQTSIRIHIKKCYKLQPKIVLQPVETIDEIVKKYPKEFDPNYEEEIFLEDFRNINEKYLDDMYEDICTPFIKDEPGEDIFKENLVSDLTRNDLDTVEADKFHS